MSIFTENLIVILENIRLYEMIDESQREIIYRLGEVIESRSNETGNHVKRVAHYVEQLAGDQRDVLGIAHIWILEILPSNTHKILKPPPGLSRTATE